MFTTWLMLLASALVNEKSMLLPKFYKASIASVYPKIFFVVGKVLLSCVM